MIKQDVKMSKRTDSWLERVPDSTEDMCFTIKIGGS